MYFYTPVKKYIVKLKEKITITLRLCAVIVVIDLEVI